MSQVFLRIVQVLILLLLSGNAGLAQWQSIGSLGASEPKGNQETFSSRQATVVVTVLAPDLIRVRMVHVTSLPPDHSYAVVKTDWPSAPAEFSGDKETRIIRTPELEVRAQLSPFRLAFYDRKGNLISKDADTRGMSWDGPRIRCWKWMPEDEHYYGLGEKSTPLDKRGRSYVMWNQDPAGFDASSEPLYQSVPFFIGLREGRAYGLFFDNTYRSSFDMGAEDRDLYSFGAEGGEMNYYFFAGPTPKQVVSRFTELVGRIPLPPRWSLGYIQSRYSYYPESKVRFIAQNFRERGIPCDAIFLDIDYMDGFRIFTWDKSRFPDPKKMMTELRRQGFRFIAIVDPYVKVDPDFWVYQQGIANGYFLKKSDGTIFEGKGWPGASAFPDYASEKVREWWGSLFKEQLEQGISGFLTDMNEPTVLADRGLPKTLDLNMMHAADYGPRPHAEIHNVYGMLETLATRDGMLRAHPNERPLIITRATYAGGQRYAAEWSGDNWGTWDHLRLSMPMLNNMGLSGFQFFGADIGGIFPVPSPELYARWLQSGVLTPFCWTHSVGPGNLEPWAFGNQLEEINRNSIKLRYHLLPYIYTAFWEAAETGIPIMRPLLLEYPDDWAAVDKNDEYLFGDDLLVAPVTKDYDAGREVYLPRGIWYDYWTDRRYTGPANIAVAAPLERMPLFVRGGAIIPSQQDVEYTDEAPIDPLTFDVYPDGNSSREYYEDDGISFDYQHGVFLRQHLSATQEARGVSVEISAREGSYTPHKRSLVIKVHGEKLEPRQVTVAGKDLERQSSLKALQAASEGWAYDEDAGVVWVRVPDRGTALKLKAQH
ncbi:MAG: glycoside hydrolase family 31 protein [Acidobacteriia bacterium]|nr:glycoside hydrolase family 31 protein [Terriglobia bacterium]